MTAEEYLLQARMLEEKINNKMTELSQLRGMVSEISSPIMGEHSHSSVTKDRLGSVVAKISDHKKEVVDDIDGYVDLKSNIIKTIVICYLRNKGDGRNEVPFKI